MATNIPLILHAVVLVGLLERPGAEPLLDPEHLEQVELEIPQVALVVAHLGAPLWCGALCECPRRGTSLPSGNKQRITCG